MNNLIKVTVFLAATLLATNQAVAKPKSVSENISRAPALEASYEQVQQDLAKHIGVNVRWGGQVIGSKKLDDKVTRVTLLAYPLDATGKPAAITAGENKAFAVNFDSKTLPRRLKVGSFVTVYGTVESGLKLTNGPLESLIPVVASLESKKWKSRNIVGSNSFARDRIRYYNSLGFAGNRFGFAGSRFGFGSSRFGFGSSRFGFSSSRFGFGGSKFGFGSRGFSKFGKFGRF